MKLGLTYWMLGGFDGKVPVDEVVRRAKDMGYESIELNFGPGVLGPDTDGTELQRVRRVLDESGLILSSLASVVGWDVSLASAEEAERNAALEFTRRYMRAAAALGTDAVLILPGIVEVPWAPERPMVSAATVYRHAQDSIRKLLSLAETLGVALCIENVWNRFLTGPFEMAAFIDSFESPWVKAYFDVGNCVVNGHPEHWIEVLGARIHRVHFKNFHRRNGGGTLNDFTGSLLEGSVNWKAVYQALREIRYDGYLTAEVLISERGLPDADMSARVAGELRQIHKQFTSL